MTRALVTGASSGIGLAITKVLLDTGFMVFGASRGGFKSELNGNIVEFRCDLTQEAQIKNLADFVEERGGVDLLVNCAGVGHFANHKDLAPEKITQMVDLNLKAPLILTRLLEKMLIQRRGMVINIGSISARGSAKFAAVYAATKAGLESFSRSLFAEERKNGLRVATICADMTQTPFYDGKGFAPADTPGAFLDPKSIANALRFVISQKSGELVTDLVLRPQKILIKKR